MIAPPSQVWRWLVIAGACMPLACGDGGETASEPTGPSITDQGLAAVREHPCDQTLSSMSAANSTIGLVLTGTGRLEQEAYDCQRLVLSTGATGELGPLVGLFPIDATLRLARAAFTTPRTALTIYSWGAAEGTYADAYPDLAITDGGHCVWVRNAEDTDSGWQAAILAGVCSGVAGPPPDSAFQYPVFERTYPNTNAADYPRTARWEWDLDAGRQFIGVKCGDAWCAVMPRGSGQPRTRPLDGGMLEPREKVPGWSDAQHLAVYDSAAGRARPGPWASVVAYPGIAADAPPWAEGLLSARITLYGSATDPVYRALADRYYLQPGEDSGHDDLILRFPGLQDEAWL